MNKLYVELLRNNPQWESAQRRDAMNHLMARLIFCFYAEDTGIFEGSGLFTRTVEQLSENNGLDTNTRQVLSEIFRAMSIKHDQREKTQPRLPSWTDRFPYVGGGLFSGNTDVPRFNREAHTYLMHAGSLDWRQINPDIFGSMIQAVADDAERSNLGLHYTSVPNILKVLGSLFLDNLRVQLSAANTNKAKLLDLRKRMAHIRVFDPACGSGNFLIIAYKEMRAIESEINKRLGETNRLSDIPLTNFKGIELRNFSAQIAHLALIIAKFQCDVQYISSKIAISEFLHFQKDNWIVCSNALRLDWLNICPPTGTSVRLTIDNLSQTNLNQANNQTNNQTNLNQTKIDFENELIETYICGNPPYLGSKNQTIEQKADLDAVFKHRIRQWKSLDYVSGWFMKAADYGTQTKASAAFVSTKSICQGQSVPTLWSEIFKTKNQIIFAYTPFKWTNLASHNAGVIVVIVGISNHPPETKLLFTIEGSKTIVKETKNINAYLISGCDIIIKQNSVPISRLPKMVRGNIPVDGGNLLLNENDVNTLNLSDEQFDAYIHKFFGADELINGLSRSCIWINSNNLAGAQKIPTIARRIEKVRQMRLTSRKTATKVLADIAYSFSEVRQKGSEVIIAVAAISSERREYLPCNLLPPGSIVSGKCYALYDAPLWNMALIASRLHLVWIDAVCSKLGMSYSYSNTLGWNTFPVPSPLTAQNKIDMTLCAENILLAREEHFPATIADLYEPGKMPENLRLAHAHNDEVIERIYIGRRFENDTQRREKLFELYSKMPTRAAKNAAAKSTSKMGATRQHNYPIP
jgi:hypothetical protein